ncbi:DNA-directed RNA polymerase subunit beta' [Candidatus Gottesmanbacteria bacterium RIFCSPHIGHO2_01_FULL_42_12]|uniref:DNA-directed RNA polymerase subunit beta' n=1 Tax=Candidatus Gottesmanbacteria bacterium RIFCSPHIGHO2_01_FULL_42_12 TaxID=1798377 RepID=A0A1F5Z4E0_9BACT|nr:MAG: DNA-directed RNA polymerase subunit beta' [Candidatus Gottesmanbacteria bacterium RIFCSPHIGHO2_01_FULL_42_12]
MADNKQVVDLINNVIDFKGLKLELASPEIIKALSHGEVTKPETINYRTLRAEKDGLFSETIFGPTKDWECYCGKYKRIRYRGIVCDKCGVEVTQSKVRRERMGHISLAVPCAHVWYFKGIPSKISLLLDVPSRALENVIYFASYLVLDVEEEKKEDILKKLKVTMSDRQESLVKDYEGKVAQEEKEAIKKVKEVEEKLKTEEQVDIAVEEIKVGSKQRLMRLNEQKTSELSRLDEIYKMLTELVKSIRPLTQLTEEEYIKLDEYNASNFIKVGMGAEAILDVLSKQNLDKMAADLRQEVLEASGARYLKATKRLRVVDGLRRTGVKPEWMILSILPVLPPDLRPMVQLSGGRFATSDLNDLYRRVINRNNRLKHLINLGAPEIILRNEKRMLQEAVDALIDASQRPTSRAASQELKSLSDMLRGKTGRFRQNLLGKRVDYSGRSVIIVGPHLKIDQCGLPKEMALEMFKPFVLRELIVRGLAPNVKSAKAVLERRVPEVFDILEEITRDHPVLLNRAPTLHKLGIQAFYPVLVEGSAIQLHPLVCSGFNADFDGDQMAVHVPLSNAAKEEAKNLMLVVHNLLKPADGSPVVSPNKEMVLGTYLHTYIDEAIPACESVFSDFSDAIAAYQNKKISVRQKIKVRYNGKIFETTVGRILFNELLPENLRFVNETMSSSQIKKLLAKAINHCTNEDVAKLVDNLKDFGFVGSTASGISVGIFDLVMAEDKEVIIQESEDKDTEIEANYQNGLITLEEMRRLSVDNWIEATDKITDLTWEKYPESNPVKQLILSGGTRASRDTVKQISGMRGLMTDPTGKIVPMPTKSNFRKGLSVFEYVTGTRGSRKGLADTALRTADAGYLTRRLVDVSHNVIIRENDCKTTDGIEIFRNEKRSASFAQRILGKTELATGKIIDEARFTKLDVEKAEMVMVRSPLTCKSKYGICAVCYGIDLGTRNLVNVGTPVGVIAAQSIGEPGTQFTLRTKHSGGIVAMDVTQGLPRIEELFEARRPKVLSPIAEIAGKVELSETADGYKIRVRNTNIKPAEEREYLVPLTSTLKVADGDLVATGTQLSSGFLDIEEILAIKGMRGAQVYLISELQAVYESQGIPVNDKHFEVIIRKMSDKVRIKSSGDTTLLPGELLERIEFEEENARVLAEGGEPATAEVSIMGVSKAAIFTSSWLSSASFEQTTNVLVDASIGARKNIDPLIGIKENVIIGRLIPTSPERAMLE